MKQSFASPTPLLQNLHFCVKEQDKKINDGKEV